MHRDDSPKRLHVVGRKNSGKTTLVEELVREMVARGFRVGTIKHTHHRHRLDTPGKDSDRHHRAGSAIVGILTPERNALFWGNDESTAKKDRYSGFASVMADCDVVLVEGDSETSAPKIEVWRETNGEPPYAAEDESIRVVVTDDRLPCDGDIWPRSDVPGLVDRILADFAQPSS